MPGKLIFLLLAFTFNAQHAAIGQTNQWNFGLNTGASIGINSSDANLFRGNGIISGLNSQYFFGRFGLGIDGGFMNSRLNSSAINQFMIDRKFPLTSSITSSSSQNSFLLAGPSLRLGERVQFVTSIKAGLFFNQSGGLVIAEPGAVRSLYQFSAGNKSLYPGYSGSASFAYPVADGSSLLLSASFLQSASAIRLYDPQQGIDIPVEQKRNWQTINVGISFIKSFETKQKRDAASGLPTGRRSRETGSGLATGKRSRDAGSGLPTGRRQYSPSTFNNPDGDDDGESIIDPETKRVLKTKTRSNQSNDRTSTQSCGPVTTKTTHPDGTIEEQTFSCPDDAANYKTKIDGGMPNRISMNVTVPKQTQGATFGEKVNRGLQAAGSIVSGRIIHRTASGNTSIVTNRSHSQNADAAVNVNTGISMNLYAREHSSGMATGKRSRETGSGMATGRRQYQPFYSESGGLACTTCAASVAGNPIGGLTIKAGRNVGSDSTTQRNGSGVAGAADENNAADLSGIAVHLLDNTTGAVLASTSTDKEGAFWFANVPTGKYTVEIDGMVYGRKGYQYYMAKSDMNAIDVAGEVLLGDDVFELEFDAPNEGTGVLKANHNTARSNKNTMKGDGGNSSDSLQQKANINTSRSNTKGIIVIGSDTDGDGIGDRFTATALLTNGRTVPVNDMIVRKKPGLTEITIPFYSSSAQKANINTSRSNIKQATITVGDGTNGTGVRELKVTGTFSDGNTREATQLAETVYSPGVFQISIELGDSDGDAQPDFIWSPRSNLAVTSQSETTNRSSLPAAAFEGSPVFVKRLPLYFNTNTAKDEPPILAGNQGTISPAAIEARPGNPIKGIIVKGGKNPGGQMRQLQTNDYGEFEFTGLDAGNYSISAGYEIYINDQTTIEVGDISEGDATTRAQDHNSSRSNKTASSVAPNPGGDTSKTKAQDHNSSSSNKTASSVAPNPGGGVSTKTKAQVNDLLQTVFEVEDLLHNDNTSNRTGINTSRSNIKNLQNALFDLQRALNGDNAATIQSASLLVEQRMQLVQSALLNLGTRYTTISNVLKTKHDTAKNSISNVR